MSDRLTIVEQPADGRVSVLGRKEITPYLKSLPGVADAALVDRLHSLARHLATWQPTTVAWSDF